MVHRSGGGGEALSRVADRQTPIRRAHSSCQRVLRVSLAALLACALLATSPAANESGGGRGAVEVELHRTDRVIERAAEEVREAANVFSHQQLSAARDLQRRAWSEFHAEHLEMALGLTLKARKAALKAIDAARIEARAGENVGRTVDQAQERVAEVGEQVDHSGNPLARRIFDQGIDQLHRARRAYLGGNLQQASRLAGLALSLIDRAGRIADEQITAASATETAVERTSVLLAEVEVLLAESGSPQPETSAFGEARRMLAGAQDHLRRGNFRHAFRLSLRARQRGLDLLTRLRQAPPLEDLRATLEDLMALAADLAPEIAASGSKEASRRFAEAQELLGEARQLLSEGKAKEALRILVAAESLLREAAEAAGPK